MEDSAERAVLVGVDLTVRPRATRAGLDGARRAAIAPSSSDEADGIRYQRTGRSAAPGRRVRLPNSPGLDADESLAEFRELVRSAGGEVAAELMQRRARPDPATLIGAGKVEEIAGVAASTERRPGPLRSRPDAHATAQP